MYSKFVLIILPFVHALFLDKVTLNPKGSITYFSHVLTLKQTSVLISVVLHATV